MNPKLEKIRDELASKFRKTLEKLSWCGRSDCERAFIEGFNSAEPHIRQDEQEKILDILEKFVDEDEYHQIERAIKKGKQDE